VERVKTSSKAGVPEMQAVRGALRGVVRVLTAGLSPRPAGDAGAESTLTILDVLEPRTDRF